MEIITFFRPEDLATNWINDVILYIIQNIL
jgi:hypothetical protein